MEIVKFYQDVGMGNNSTSNDQVWAKMKGAAGGDSPDPSRSRSGSASREMSRENSHEGGALSSVPKFANPVCLSPSLIIGLRSARCAAASSTPSQETIIKHTAIDGKRHLEPS